MKHVVIMLMLIPALSLAGWVIGGDQLQGKKALDLPVDGGRFADEDDEDAPESIRFYGSEYEGDGFFWCFHAFNF